jgi:hypothetical protein
VCASNIAGHGLVHCLQDRKTRLKTKEILDAPRRTTADDAEKARSVKELMRELVERAELIEVKLTWYVDPKVVKRLSRWY